MVFALSGDRLVQVSGQSAADTFDAYRELPDAAHGMIAWPNTVLLTGPSTIVVDPGYQTQGDMLEGALARRGLSPDDVPLALATHLHSDHITALPQLGEVELVVHEDELETPHGVRQRGARDAASLRLLSGGRGEVAPGIRWIHTPGHSPGHVSYLVDGDEGLVVIAGDTLGPRPEWFAENRLPEGFPEREAHLEAFRRIRAESPRRVIPGHNPQFVVAP